ncbi:MAG: TetR/AcrR family transcriptional regulator [Proteobacteria bacterium]|nr:TetR/AcrR family transcriptional regulator [Pseudomonadota bacterium]
METKRDAAASEKPQEADEIREQLLEAAARVFASKGYAGTKILDIVREAGLSSGAVYGRFESKNALLIEAVVTRAIKAASERVRADRPVADFIARSLTDRQGPLNTTEAIQLEAYVAARREPEVAEAVAEARRRWRFALKRTVRTAHADGTLSPGADVESILYFMETMRLGLLLLRGAGFAPPDPDQWDALIRRIVRSLAAGQDNG